MIEDPGSAGGPLGLRKRSVKVRVHIKANDAGLPFDGVEMKGVRKVLGSGKAEGSCCVAGATDCAGAVKRAVDRTGLFADVFHDVDFAALGPIARRDVTPQHPERGPHSLPCGDLDARFKAAVGLAEETLRFQAGGSVIARCVIRARKGSGFLLRGDDQVPAPDVRVLHSIGVAL